MRGQKGTGCRWHCDGGGGGRRGVGEERGVRKKRGWVTGKKNQDMIGIVVAVIGYFSWMRMAWKNGDYVLYRLRLTRIFSPFKINAKVMTWLSIVFIIFVCSLSLFPRWGRWWLNPAFSLPIFFTYHIGIIIFFFLFFKQKKSYFQDLTFPFIDFFVTFEIEIISFYPIVQTVSFFLTTKVIFIYKWWL